MAVAHGWSASETPTRRWRRCRGSARRVGDGRLRVVGCAAGRPCSRRSGGWCQRGRTLPQQRGPPDLWIGAVEVADDLTVVGLALDHVVDQERMAKQRRGIVAGQEARD